MIPGLEAALWGLCVLASMAGWGWALKCVVTPSSQVDWGWLTAWGFALNVCLGGFLEAAGVISKPAIIGLVICGLILLVAGIRSTGLRPTELLLLPVHGPVAATAFGLIAFLVVIRFTGSVQNPSDAFNPHDDFQGYLVFIQRMLQTGSMGSDPFNLRRTLTSWNGQAFLQTYLLALLPFGSSNLLEAGLGTMLVAAVVSGQLRRTGTVGIGAALVLFAFLLTPPPVVNTTSQVVSLALFISLFRVLDLKDLPDQPLPKKSVLVALHVTAICTRKSNLIPTCVSMVGICYCLEWIDGPRSFRGAATTLVLSVVLLLPWLADSYRFTGTALYPLLGKGYGKYAYTNFRTPYGAFHISQAFRDLPFFPLILAGVLPAIGGAFSGRCWRENRTRVALAGGVYAGALAIFVGLNGFSTYRFVFPFLWALILIELGYLLSPKRNDSRPPLWVVITVAGAIMASALEAGAFAMYEQAAKRTLATMPWSSVGWDVPTPNERALQLAVPPGAPILVRLRRPFLLDFRRNPIYVADIPGGSGLAPGMPLFSGAEAVAAYLLSNSIYYLAYDYRFQAGFPHRVYENRLTSPFAFPRTAARLTFDFQDSVVELGRMKKRIYDDGSMFVLKLNETAEPQSSRP